MNASNSVLNKPVARSHGTIYDASNQLVTFVVDSCPSNVLKMLQRTVLLAAVVLPAASSAAVYLPVVPVPGSFATVATGINDSNIIAGYFTDANGQHIFVGTLDGKYTTCDLKGIKTPVPTSINDDGVVIGNSEIGSFYSGNSCGYFLIGKGRKLKPLNQENVFQIANNDRLIGYYTDRKSGQIKGFYAQSAQYKSDFSLGFQNNGEVKPSGINSQGSVVGYAYIDAYQTLRAFLYQNGATTFIDYAPNVTTYPRSINDNDIVAGEFVTSDPDRQSHSHAYLYNTQTKKFRELKVKNSDNVYVSGTLNSAGYVPLQTDNASLIYCPYTKSKCEQN